MDSGLGNSYFFPTLSSHQPLFSSENFDGGRYPYPLDPQSHFFDESLEDVFSRLNLSSSESHPRPPLPAALNGDVRQGPVVNIPAGDGTFVPVTVTPGGEKILHQRKPPNFANGPKGFGGAHHGNLTAGPERWVAPGTGGSYPTAAREPWYTDDGRISSSVFRHQEDDGSFLQRKKQSSVGLNSQFPIVSCSSNRSCFFTDSDQHFDGLRAGFACDNSSISRPNNWYNNTQRLDPMAQHWDCFSWEDLRGQIVSLSKDQFGCRLLQKKFETPNDEEIEAVFSEVIDHMGELMQHQFGNYLVQKLVKVCNEEQRTQIILAVTKSQFQLIGICLNQHGTRAVQKLLEYITSQHQISLVMAALSSGAVALATDQSGHHVIQHCLIHFSTEDNKDLLNEMADNCFEVATNKSGCCVLQSCVDHSQGECREHLVAEIIANAYPLAEDPYGNYVVQHLLGMSIPEVTENLMRQLEGKYVTMSFNKYASHVVQKCLVESGEEQSSRVIVELLRSSNIRRLLVHPFANYVIQSALAVSKGLVHNALLNAVRMNAPYMYTNLYGKNILAWLDKRKLQN